MTFHEIDTDPTDEFSIPCTGDVVAGDRIRFTEGVFTGSHRRPKFAGSRTIEAEVVADSYGGDKQQHTFSLVVTTAEGMDAPAVGTKTRRKGRNVYRNGCYRAPWTDEAARKAALDEKHHRGDFARQARDERREAEGYYG